MVFQLFGIARYRSDFLVKVLGSGYLFGYYIGEPYNNVNQGRATGTREVAREELEGKGLGLPNPTNLTFYFLFAFRPLD